MKNLFFTLVFTTLFLQSLDAQVAQGNLLAGGSLSFSSEKDSESTVTTFQFSPAIGYFFADKFAGGLRSSFSSMKMEGIDAVTDLLSLIHI